MNCPICDQPMEQEEHDPSTNIAGGFSCEACDVFIHDSEVDHSDDLHL